LPVPSLELSSWVMTTLNPTAREIRLPAVHGVELPAVLTVPPLAAGVVLLAGPPHGKRETAHVFSAAMQAAGLATMRVDLLDVPAGADLEQLVDIFVVATEWLLQDPETQPLNIGYLSTDLGAAAALVAASRAPDCIDAVVSIAGRPDLAGERLANVRAATLLVAAEGDANLPGNRQAFERLWKDKSLETIPGDAQLMNDPRALQLAADLSARWFVRHLTALFHSSPTA
jgi:putative phosphoribosyl transferase